MLQIGNKEIKQMNIGNTSVKEVYLGSELVWPSGPDPANEWYGVLFEGDSTTGTRIGNLEYHKLLPLQSLMRRCVITDNQAGGADFISDSNPNQFEDGTPVPYGSTLSDYKGNIMVRIPELWYTSHYDTEADTWELKISPVYQEGWMHSPLMYVGAFEGVAATINNRTNVMASLSGLTPLSNINVNEMHSRARAFGDRWSAYTYKAHKAITFLFVVEYANRNSQADFNSELTVEGYHQGGLGMGVTQVSNAIQTGNTVQYGNQSYGANNGTDSISYRGIENPFGNVWKNTIDCWVSNGDFYYCDDPTKYSYTVTTDTDGYELIGTQPTSNGYIKSLVDNEIVVAGVGGSNAQYFCDYLYANTGTNNLVLIGGRWGTSSYAGVFTLSCDTGRSVALSLIGSRLVFEPYT